MTLIYIWDPDNTDNYGSLYSKDPIIWNHVVAGGAFNLFITEHAATSEDPKNLFYLKPPPSFHGQFMVWGAVNNNTGILVLYLSPTSGNKTYPFADLHDFKEAAIDGSKGQITGSGTGYLNRPNKLPTGIEWELSP